MKIINRLFEVVVLFQLCFTFTFFMFNINDLSNVTFHLDVAGVTQDVDFSFYSLLAVVGILFVTILVFSFNTVGSGLNDTGTSYLAKYVSFTMLFVILDSGTLYYTYPLGSYALIIHLFFFLIYVLKAIDTINGDVSE